MKAVIFNGPGKIELGERPDPKIQEPTDAVVRVVLGCVCDLRSGVLVATNRISWRICKQL